MSNKDWLDDPEWEALRKKVESRPEQSKKQRKKRVQAKVSVGEQSTKDSSTVAEDHKQVNVSLNFKLPTRSHINRKRDQVSAKIKNYFDHNPDAKRNIIIVVVVITSIIVMALLIPRLFFNNDDQKGGSSGQAGNSGATTQPDFKVSYPEGDKDRASLSKTNYDPQRKVASFKDTVNAVEITVSQQPMPEAFKKDMDKEVENMAKGFNATDPIDTKIKSYKGKSAQGPQTVITHNKEALIFLYASSELSDQVWKAYIDNLQ